MTIRRILKGDFLDRIPVRFRRGSLPSHYRSAFDTPSGRVVLANLCREGNMMKTNGGFTGDALQFEEGKRYIVCYIMGMLGLEPQDLPQAARTEVIDD